MVTIQIGATQEDLSWEQWEQRVRQGRVPSTALIRFEPITGDAFQLASELDIYQSLRADANRAWSDRYRAGPPPWMTALVAGAQIRLWWLLFTSGADGRPVVDALILSHARVLEDGEVWRMVTMGILHTAPLHILANLAMLIYVGWNLERALGRVNLATIFFGSVLGGSLLSLLANPGVLSLGASGGVLGVVAAATVFGFVKHNLLSDRARVVFGWALFPYLALVYLSGWSNETTDNWAHTGGLVAGAVLALLLDPPGLERRKGWGIAAPSTVVGLCLLTLGTLWWIGPRAIGVVDSIELQRTAPPSRDYYREIEWSAPASWVRGTAHGRPGFISKGSKKRLWSVRLRELTTYSTLDKRVVLLREDLESHFGTALEIETQEPITLSEIPGRKIIARITGEPPLRLEASVALRGTTAVETLWIVEERLAPRFRDLHHRLTQSIYWNEPSRLVEARAEVARRPKSRAARKKLAEATSSAGLHDEAEALWEELIVEHPELPDGWIGLLGHKERAAGEDGAPRELWERAVAQSESPQVFAEVAISMHAHGEEALAFGLIELAWLATPGERSLRRARRTLGLPVDLDHATPAHLLIDPYTGSPLEEPRLRPQPITLESLREAGEDHLSVRDALIRDITEASDPSALGALLLLQNGLLPSPEDLGAALTSAIEELDLSSRGIEVRRIPHALATWAQGRLADDPDWLDELREAAEQVNQGEVNAVIVGLTITQGPSGPTFVRAVDRAPPAP